MKRVKPKSDSYNLRLASRRLRLASRLWGLQTDYVDATGRLISASSEVLMQLLAELSGETVKGSKDIVKLIQIAREKRLKQCFKPCYVAYAGESCRLSVMLKAADMNKKLKIVFRSEAGQTFTETFTNVKTNGLNSSRAVIGRPNDKTKNHVVLEPRLSFSIGYYRMELFVGNRSVGKSLLLYAPSQKKTEIQPRRWGLFAPLYALRSERNWGIGDLTDLQAALKFVSKHGGSFFGVLPLLAAVNEGESLEPSPYSPVSRLFWNEIYLDVEALAAQAKSKSVAVSTEVQREIHRLQAEPVVDYAAVYALKKPVLMGLAQEFFKSGVQRSPEYLEFIKRAPLLKKYAEFRAGTDRRQKQFHLYVQFQMDRALAGLKARSDAGRSAGLYMDYPIGVARGGFDNVVYSSAFLGRASAGAPPDLFFSGGQNWGFAPFHPEHLREQGYDYFIQSVRQHMRHATVMRFDHVAALNRIYAIPQGAGAKSGTYIRYRHKEFYAILTIEAARSGVRIVGEDLGTVPVPVREALNENDALHMWVLPFEAGRGLRDSLRRMPIRSLACINTHDMVPFAGYSDERDLDILKSLKLIDEEQLSQERRGRRKAIKTWMKENKVKSVKTLLKKLLEQMAASHAELLLVNVEDLSLETEPQNVPGTWREYPNWKRKLRQSVRQWDQDTWSLSVIKSLARLRPQKTKGNNGNVRRKKTRNRDVDSYSARSSSLQ